MNWAWASSLDQIWNLPTVPMWITLGAAGFFGLCRSDHAAARREISRQRHVDGRYITGRRCRGRSHHSRLRSARPGRIGRNPIFVARKLRRLAGIILHRRPRRRYSVVRLREGAVWFGRIYRRGRGLHGVPGHAADHPRRCGGCEQEHDFQNCKRCGERWNATAMAWSRKCCWCGIVARRRNARPSARSPISTGSHPIWKSAPMMA